MYCRVKTTIIERPMLRGAKAGFETVTPSSD